MILSLYQRIEACRSCGSSDLAEVLNLGFFALSDFKDSPDDFTDRAPLELVRCAACTLVQLRHTVDRDRLYRQYWYRSATQPAMVSALRDVVDDATARVPLRPGDVVIDIGANDGTLLRQYETEGLYRIGYEPAENLWPLLRGESRNPQREISAIYGYFPQMVGHRVVGMSPKAKIITSIACFYDVDDPGQFVEGIKACLAEDGVWINQMSYLPETLRTGNFGDFCHEHLTYWSGQSFSMLLWNNQDLVGRRALHWESSLNDVNGGSIRFVMKWSDRTGVWGGEAPTDSQWADFRERIWRQRDDVRDWLRMAKVAGNKVIGYGASTKGNTYLQYWNIDPYLLPTIADRNPEKWGKYTPTGQRVISEEEARAERPDFFFVLPFHFIDAFVERESEFLAGGGKFVVPFPDLHYVRGGGARHADILSEATVPDDGAAVRP